MTTSIVSELTLFIMLPTVALLDELVAAIPCLALVATRPQSIALTAESMVYISALPSAGPLEDLSLWTLPADLGVMKLIRQKNKAARETTIRRVDTPFRQLLAD
jgi:hypothetical protein